LQRCFRVLMILHLRPVPDRNEESARK
jgi:hypothetical protein